MKMDCLALASFTHNHTATPTPRNENELPCACEFYTQPHGDTHPPAMKMGCLALVSFAHNPPAPKQKESLEDFFLEIGARARNEESASRLKKGTHENSSRLLVYLFS